MSEPQQVQQTDRRDLKILALRERIAKIVVDYEDQDADRRIEITEKQQRIEALEEQLNQMGQALMLAQQEAKVVEEEPLADDTTVE